MKKTIALIFLFGCWFSQGIMAQRTALIHGTYVYEVSDNDNITLKDAKRKCIELAKAKAIKDEFGEMITSDVIDSNVETNGESTSSYFWENTVAMAKGDWLQDTQEPEIRVEYINGKLVFTAEVWGEAAEIIQAKTELECIVQKDDDGKRIGTAQFNNGERIYMKFRAPADGFLAVYLIVGDDEANCLLPYRKDADGKFPISGGKNYNLFDKEQDPTAVSYKMTTKREMEDNQLVIIYSPNSFVKCNDVSRDPRHPNIINTHDFQKWLLRCQRQDRDMVVDKKYIRIVNNQ